MKTKFYIPYKQDLSGLKVTLIYSSSWPSREGQTAPDEPPAITVSIL